MEIVIGIAGIVATLVALVVTLHYGKRPPKVKAGRIDLQSSSRAEKSKTHDDQSAVELPPLQFEKHDRYNIIKGFLPHWHHGQGDYESGDLFIYLEYECNLSKPEEVRIQVEGPRADVNPAWNVMKVSLFNRVKELFYNISRDIPWYHKLGRLASLENVRKYSSTTVFSVVASGSDTESDPAARSRLAIERAHQRIGADLEKTWQAWWSEHQEQIGNPAASTQSNKSKARYTTMQDKTNSGLKVEWYCVAFVDILGQSQLLEQFAEIPFDDDSEEKKEFLALCSQTYGRIITLTDDIQQQFSILTDPQNITTGVPDKYHDLWRELTSFEIRVERYSDGFAVYVPLAADRPLLHIYAVSLIISTMASTALLSLARGYSIRGGIDVGHGCIMPDGNLYGPGVYSAYKLESQVAQYPRIVIGNHAINYVNVCESMKAEEIGKTHGIEDPELYAALANRAARHSRNHFCKDHDGYPILDYLDTEFLSTFGDLAYMDRILESAYAFVIDQSNLFKNTRNTKLALRYAVLREYFEARQPKLRKKELE